MQFDSDSGLELHIDSDGTLSAEETTITIGSTDLSVEDVIWNGRSIDFAEERLSEGLVHTRLELSGT